MKRFSLFIFTLLGTQAAYAYQYDAQARVLRADPIYERVNSPRQECWTEYREAPDSSEDNGTNIAGQVVGGVVGGLLGNQVGGGHGREVATAGGAIAGAIIGGRVQQQNSNKTQAQGRQVREERRCRQVDQWSRRITGYDVSYEYQGRTYRATLPDDPGRMMSVRVNIDVIPN